MNLSKVIAKRPFLLLRSAEDIDKDAAAVSNTMAVLSYFGAFPTLGGCVLRVPSTLGGKNMVLRLPSMPPFEEQKHGPAAN